MINGEGIIIPILIEPASASTMLEPNYYIVEPEQTASQDIKRFIVIPIE